MTKENSDKKIKEYEDVASNEYAQKAFEAYLKFEATCKLLDITPEKTRHTSI